MAGSIAGCGCVVGRHTVKVDVPADAIQQDGGNSPFAQLLEHRGVVSARDKNQPVNLTFDEGADPFAFGGKVFLGVRQNDLVIGTGSSLFDAPNDAGKKARGDVGYYHAVGARAAFAYAQSGPMGGVTQGGDCVLDPFLKVRPHVTGTPQNIGNCGGGHSPPSDGLRSLVRTPSRMTQSEADA